MQRTNASPAIKHSQRSRSPPTCKKRRSPTPTPSGSGSGAGASSGAGAGSGAGASSGSGSDSGFRVFGIGFGQERQHGGVGD